MFWPVNPEESGKIQAAAADFSSLTLEQKHLWVTAAMCISQYYRLRYVKFSRRMKKEYLLEDNYTWASYLNVKELVMMKGDMDYEEAKNVFKKTIKVRRPIYSFEDRLREKDNEQYDLEHCNEKYPSSYYYYGEDKYASSYYYFGEDKYASSYYYYDEDNYDEEIDKNKKPYSEEKRCILDPKEREYMLANVESYRIKMERATRSRIRKKTESDDEGAACSETKFNQSDEGA